MVSGIFAGAAVNFEKTFQIGDLVTISNIKGTVEDISMLTTKLRTENGETVYVPNQLIFNTPFINHSKKYKPNFSAISSHSCMVEANSSCKS